VHCYVTPDHCVDSGVLGCQSRALHIRRVLDAAQPLVFCFASSRLSRAWFHIGGTHALTRRAQIFPCGQCDTIASASDGESIAVRRHLLVIGRVLLSDEAGESGGRHMPSDTREYYRQRAAAERRHARAATDGRAAAIHAALAEEYEKLAKKASA
jgi:hypothetical protein